MTHLTAAPTQGVVSHPRQRNGSPSGVSQTQLPAPGDTVAGKYALVRQLGEGGMGVVYEAMHTRLHQRLAIKVLRPDVHDVEGVLARFEREAHATAQLRSVHTARVIDVDKLPDGLPYIVLEFLEGRDLEAELAHTGPMPIEDAVDIVLQVAEAMSEAHGIGIVHRDLKPSNLFVCRVGGRRMMKVLDFGISKIDRESERITATDTCFGTPHYAAPEQLRNARDADARSDVWSLGVILFELITGTTPFTGSPTEVIAKVMADPLPWPVRLRSDVPMGLANAILRALQREPHARFQSMRELTVALAGFARKHEPPASVVGASRGRLGEILVSEGLIGAADLQDALEEQRRSGKLLGRVLLDMGMVGRADLMTALAKQQGIHAGQPVPPLVHRRNRLTWAAVALGLPVGIVAAAALAVALRTPKEHHEAAGLVTILAATSDTGGTVERLVPAPAPSPVESSPRSAASPLPVAKAPRPRVPPTTPPRAAPTFDPTTL